MSVGITRREFMAASAAIGAGLVMAGPASAAPPKTTLRKALIGNPDRKLLERWKAAGFEGVEWSQWDATPEEAVAARKLAETLGMRIHSVMFGWATMNEGDTALAESVARINTALRTAQACGAEAVLVVPCRVDVKPIPEPWEFDIRFDERSGHLQQVVDGDNSPYRKYIEAHDHAVDTAREGVQRLIPAAEQTNVVIALENVWNNLWVEPDLFANFVASFNHPWVRAYFDIGNHVKYAPPEEWIDALGKLIVKCHVKDFQLNPDGHGGSFCNILDGSVDWPAVRSALDEIGYYGWLSIEGGDLSPEEHGKRLAQIIADE